MEKQKKLTRRQFLTKIGATGMALGMASKFAGTPAWGELKPADKVNWQQDWERTKAAVRQTTTDRLRTSRTPQPKVPLPGAHSKRRINHNLPHRDGLCKAANARMNNQAADLPFGPFGKSAAESNI